MKFNLHSIPKELTGSGVEVGQVYQNTRGKFQLVIRVINDTAMVLSFDETGNIIGADRYAFHYLERKRVVGFVSEMPTLEVDWY